MIMVDHGTICSTHKHSNTNIIFTILSSLAALKVLRMATPKAASNENVVIMVTFPSKWQVVMCGEYFTENWPDCHMICPWPPSLHQAIFYHAQHVQGKWADLIMTWYVCMWGLSWLAKTPSSGSQWSDRYTGHCLNLSFILDRPG